MGITVLSPDLNQSEVEFTVVYDAEPNPKLACPKGKPVCQNKKVLDPLRPRIRFGLGAIKGLGGAALEAVLEARNSDDDGVRLAQSRPFESLFDFGARVDLRRVNKNVVEALIQSGSFDGLHQSIGVHRAQAFAAIEAVIERGKKLAAEKISGQTNLFGLLGGATPQASKPSAQYPQLPPWDSREQLKREKTSLGFYVSGHPLDRYATELKRICNATTASLAECDNHAEVSIGGTIEGFRKRPTKTGGQIGFVQIEDSLGSVEVIVGDRLLKDEALVAILESKEPVVLTGKVRRRRKQGDDDDDAEETTEVSLTSAKLLTDALQTKTTLVCVKLDATQTDRATLASLRDELAANPGKVPVALDLVNAGQWTVKFKATGMRVEPSEKLLAGLERLFGRKVCEFR